MNNSQRLIVGKWKKILLAGIITIAAVSITNTLFEKQVDNLLGRVYLYFTNDSLVKFSDVTLDVPIYYIRTQSKDYLTLLHYPTGDGLIMARLGSHLSRNEFVERYSTFLPQAGLKKVNEGIVHVGGVQGYSIEAMSKTDPNYFRIFIVVPDKNFLINYMGNEKEKETFFSVIKSVSFEN
jgi:hypothetical protein